MPKSRKLESFLESLKQVRQNPTTEESIAQLRQILNSPYAMAIAQASKVVAQSELTQFVPELVAAFDRCLVNPVETDPNCHAKVGIADALYRMDYRESELFLKGIRHIQMEPVWGTKVDTAAKLRSTCALGLVRANYADAMTELADLLADPEIPARVGAARAIAYSENTVGVPLLRLRARVGDEPEVVAECLISLLQMAPKASLSFVIRFLQDPRPQMQELTALALGESRLPEAFEPLKQWWERLSDPELRQIGLLAIALLRQDTAIQFLLDLVASDHADQSDAAVEALRTYEGQAQIWGQVEEAIARKLVLHQGNFEGL